MDIFDITLKTSIKIGNGRIIPAGKQFSGELQTLPNWLITEIEAESSAISILKTPMNTAKVAVPPPFKNIVEPAEERNVNKPPISTEKAPVSRKSMRRTKTS